MGSHCVGVGLYSLTLKISTILPVSFTISERGPALCLALTGTPAETTRKTHRFFVLSSKAKMYFLLYSAEAFICYILNWLHSFGKHQLHFG